MLSLFKLPPVLWIGGGCGAGKTTVSRALALANDLGWYRIDAHGYEHRDRLVERGSIDVETRSHDQRWLQPTPGELADEFIDVATRRFPLIIEDLRRLDREVGVIVEGPQLLPSLVQPYLPDPGPAVWLLPSAGFRRTALEARKDSGSRLTNDAAAARERLLERNQILDTATRADARRLDLAVVEVDGGRDLPAMIEYLSHHFAGPLHTMPRIRNGMQRRILRQQENDDMVGNVRAFLAERPAQDRPESTMPFCCECDQLGCSAVIDRTMAEYEDARQRHQPLVHGSH